MLKKVQSGGSLHLFFWEGMTKAMLFQGTSSLAKLLEASPPGIVPGNKMTSKTRDLKLLHISSGNKTSLAVKKHLYLTSSVSGWCNLQAWSLPPLELFVLPSGEPRNETISSCHHFSAEWVFQPGLLYSTIELWYQRKGSTGKCYPESTRAQPRALLFMVHHPSALGVPVAHTVPNITAIIWAKSRFPKPERAEESVNMTAEKKWIVIHKGLS